MAKDPIIPGPNYVILVKEIHARYDTNQTPTPFMEFENGQTTVNARLIGYMNKLITECSWTHKDTRNTQYTTMFLEWCTEVENTLFLKYKYKVWESSLEKYVSQDILGAKVFPLVMFIAIIITLVCVPLLRRIDKQQRKAIWCLLFWYNMDILFLLLTDTLPKWIYHNVISLPHQTNYQHYNRLGCKFFTFLTEVVNNVPKFIVAILVMTHVKSDIYETKAISRLAAKIILIFILIGHLVMNVHTIWLYDYIEDRTSKTNDSTTVYKCEKTPGESLFFKTYYAILTKGIHSSVPILICFVSIIAITVNRSCGRSLSPIKETTVIAIMAGLSFVVFHTPSLIFDVYQGSVLLHDTLENIRTRTLWSKVLALWDFLRVLLLFPMVLALSTTWRNDLKCLYYDMVQALNALIELYREATCLCRCGNWWCLKRPKSREEDHLMKDCERLSIPAEGQHHPEESRLLCTTCFCTQGDVREIVPQIQVETKTGGPCCFRYQCDWVTTIRASYTHDHEIIDETGQANNSASSSQQIHVLEPQLTSS